jgi:DNA-binding HxlR family transcriptional regulator
MLYLGDVGEAGYYDTYKQGFVVSRQTFAGILRLLEDRDLVIRRVEDARPPRVNYSLSGKGKNVLEALKLLIETLSQ